MTFFTLLNQEEEHNSCQRSHQRYRHVCLTLHAHHLSYNLLIPQIILQEHPLNPSITKFKPLTFHPNKVPLTSTNATKMTLITINNSILEALKKSKVIPEVIDDFIPSSFIQAEFSKGKQAQLGNTLKKDDTQTVPKISITSEPGLNDVEEEGTSYTLCMTGMYIYPFPLIFRTEESQIEQYYGVHYFYRHDHPYNITTTIHFSSKTNKY